MDLMVSTWGLEEDGWKNLLDGYESCCSTSCQDFREAG